MARKIRIAAAQLGGIQLAETRAQVVARLVALLREAHGQGAQLVVFPELALTTFFPRYWMEDEIEVDAFCETQMPNPAVQPLFDEAARLGVSFYLGYAELAREGDRKRRYNSAVLVGRDGRILGKYRKVHLPGHTDFRQGYPYQQLEKKYFVPGDLGFPVWWWEDNVVGMAICNDRRWPETYRVMGLQGVEVVLLGYNTHDVNQYHHESKHLKLLHHFVVMQAGAYQNGTWVVASAKTGIEDGHELIGGTCIIAPTGEIAVQAVTNEDEVIVGNCDLSLGHNIKNNRFNFEAHRRIEHYGLITERAGAILPPR